MWDSQFSSLLADNVISDLTEFIHKLKERESVQQKPNWSLKSNSLRNYRSALYISESFVMFSLSLHLFVFPSQGLHCSCNILKICE